MTTSQLVTLAVAFGLILALAVTLLVTYRHIKFTLRDIGDPELLDRETSLYKGNYFSSLTTASIDSFERYQSHFTLLVFNFDRKCIEGMKADAKKETLAKVGTKVRGAIRATDKAGRPSVDSIAVLLYNTEGKQAKPVEKRIATVLEKTMPEARIRVTTWTTPEDIGLMRMYIQA